jgi:ribosome-associated protein
MSRIALLIQAAANEFQWTYARAGGPGGQNVNKVASKAILRWNPVNSSSLPADLKLRILSKLANRLTKSGDLLLVSQRFRDQERNRNDVLERLHRLIELAATQTKTRKTTKPTRSSKEKRLRAKQRRSVRKSGRRAPAAD